MSPRRSVERGGPPRGSEVAAARPNLSVFVGSMPRPVLAGRYRDGSCASHQKSDCTFVVLVAMSRPFAVIFVTRRWHGDCYVRRHVLKDSDPRVCRSRRHGRSRVVRERSDLHVRQGLSAELLLRDLGRRHRTPPSVPAERGLRQARRRRTDHHHDLRAESVHDKYRLRNRHGLSQRDSRVVLGWWRCAFLRSEHEMRCGRPRDDDMHHDHN